MRKSAIFGIIALVSFQNPQIALTKARAIFVIFKWQLLGPTDLCHTVPKLGSLFHVLVQHLLGYKSWMDHFY